MSLPAAFLAPSSLVPHSGRLSCSAGWTAVLAAGLMLGSGLSFAQAPGPLPAASAPVAHGAMPALSNSSTPSGPSWTELTPEQKQALAPLASSWNSINEPQKRKWLEISKSYRGMTPEEQAKLSSRMSEWVALSPQQRAQARLNFGKTKELSKQLTPEEKKAQWEAYQALSREEKEKLAVKASPTPRGAAPAVKPVAPQKLAVLPAALASAPKPAPKIVALPPVPPALAASAANAAASGVSGPAPQR